MIKREMKKSGKNAHEPFKFTTPCPPAKGTVQCLYNIGNILTFRKSQ